MEIILTLCKYTNKTLLFLLEYFYLIKNNINIFFSKKGQISKSSQSAFNDHHHKKNRSFDSIIKIIEMKLVFSGWQAIQMQFYFMYIFWVGQVF